MQKEPGKILKKLLHNKNKVVSFDIFDTLLSRPVSKPTDVFAVVEETTGVKGFAQARIDGENVARKMAISGAEDISLDEIYTQIGVRHKSWDINQLKASELEAEYQVLYPRDSVKRLYDAAIKSGKKIIAISDMYLPRDFLIKILTKNGYTNISHLFVSSQEGVTKWTGNMYRHVLQRYEKQGISACEILHIGDNYHSDYKMARKYGLSAIHVPIDIKQPVIRKIAETARVNIYFLCDKLRILPQVKKLYSIIKPKKIITHGGDLNFVENVYSDINQSLARIKGIKNDDKKDLIVFIGDFVAFCKNACQYLNNLHQRMNGVDFFYLSEAPGMNGKRISKRIKFPSMALPLVLCKNWYNQNASISLSTHQHDLITSKTYLAEAVDNLKQKHPNMPVNYPEFLVNCVYSFYSEVFNVLKPKVIVLWNEFYAIHHIIKCIAKEEGLNVSYMEFGSLPGTFAIEKTGQMGESFPAITPHQFLSLQVDHEDISHSREVLHYLQTSKLNRNTQKKASDIIAILSREKEKRPIVFYAGQNDYESGIIPYNNNSQQFHSPIFSSSDDAMEYLTTIASKHNLLLVYKPHPLMNQRHYKDTANVIYVDNADINDLVDIADVTVTILSQVGYISLIRERPTVMLGYTQLKHKMCCYEAFHIDEVEGALLEALRHGHTSSQKESFEKHVAQLLKYYLYDDYASRKLRYGRGLIDAGVFFEGRFND